MLSAGGDLRDGEAVTAAMRNVSFTGVGGEVVALDSNGDRMQSYKVMNYVVEEGSVICSVAVGLYNTSLGQYKAYGRAVVWPGGEDVPVDYIPGRVFCAFGPRWLLLSASVSVQTSSMCAHIEKNKSNIKNHDSNTIMIITRITITTMMIANEKNSSLLTEVKAFYFQPT